MAKHKQRLRAFPEQYEPGVLLKLDGRTSIYKRLRATYDEIVRDLGGEEKLSRVQLTLVERYVFLTALLATWEAKIAEKPLGSEELIGRAIQATNAAQGLAKTIGLKREAKAVPHLKAYAGGRRS